MLYCVLSGCTVIEAFPVGEVEATSCRNLDWCSVARGDGSRRKCIARAVQAGECWVVCERNDPVAPIGYGCLDRSFFGEWLIPLVVVSSEIRRSGAGRQIVSYLECYSSAEKIFTSTNVSNLPMRQLLSGLGYQHSGMVENLDPGDPELVFVKFLS
ncbi:GNAT family N-acetyltransferase [Pseudomonas sp. UV AK001]|uniref:GNAT family N-acetyltransferase n=1 Tax=Pseudomonas sp. UV AK001 TaxID=3384791 RepID=UPI0038D47F48